MQLVTIYLALCTDWIERACHISSDFVFVLQALSNDAAFVRVRKGVYALRALAGNVGPVPHNTPKSSRPPLGRGLDHRDSYRSAPFLALATVVVCCTVAGLYSTRQVSSFLVLHDPATVSLVDFNSMTAVHCD